MVEAGRVFVVDDLCVYLIVCGPRGVSWGRARVGGRVPGRRVLWGGAFVNNANVLA